MSGMGCSIRLMLSLLGSTQETRMHPVTLPQATWPRRQRSVLRLMPRVGQDHPRRCTKHRCISLVIFTRECKILMMAVEMTLVRPRTLSRLQVRLKDGVVNLDPALHMTHLPNLLEELVNPTQRVGTHLHTATTRCHLLHSHRHSGPTPMVGQICHLFQMEAAVVAEMAKVEAVNHLLT